MKKTVLALTVSCALTACSGGPAVVDPASVQDATCQEIKRVEPLSWWVGMQTDLQLLVQGPEIASFEVAVAGKGLSVKGVHKAESPNFVFVDVEVSAQAQPGTYYFIFSKDGISFKYPYLINAREEGSAQRESFSTADMIYLIMPDRFASAFQDNDEAWQGGEYFDGSARPWTVPATPDKVDRQDAVARHGGDIQGIINHLDYIADLGATAIWCTPLLLDNQPQESYHGYACSDYYHIDPRFGDNALYKTFVEECHKKGLKVIMDVVTNHCGTAHWWMEEAPFKDWYHVNEPYMQMNALFSVYMDPHASVRDRERQESGWFVPSMPDMNLDNPYVLKYFQQWAVWWIEFSGLDGLRVDTYPYNEPGPMSRWCKAVTDEYPNMNIVGECWDFNIPQVAYWQKDNPNKDGFNSNLPSIMDFPLEHALMTALCEDQVWWDEGMSQPRPRPYGRCPEGRSPEDEAGAGPPGHHPRHTAALLRRRDDVPGAQGRSAARRRQAHRLPRRLGGRSGQPVHRPGPRHGSGHVFYGRRTARLYPRPLPLEEGLQGRAGRQNPSLPFPQERGGRQYHGQHLFLLPLYGR